MTQAPPNAAQTNDEAQGGTDEGAGLPTLSLIAYRLNNVPMEIVPGHTDRLWMDNTSSRFAYRCMPMLLANQTGWMVCSSHDLEITWDGRSSIDGITVVNKGGEGICPAISTFGSGILTFTLPYLFRTPPGYNLLVQGPANMPKDGISPLSGLVETDWSESTFTMNWIFTRPGHTVTFAKGEPVAMIIPLKRYEAEQFDPVIDDIAHNPELNAAYQEWANSRREFNKDLRIKGSEAQKAKWQKHYAQGKTVGGRRTEAHQSKIKLRPFRPAQ